ncbi:MAG TPA: glycosyltransferase family 4 protein, partial [Gelidibacter sp.]|uniref:glycosyltransferase family 4 protein n=1 Tax=Gelidibacter sp. TaxID=2018083 RepID=UPI002BCD169C
YIGNHLQNAQTNVSQSAVLGPLLAQSGYQVRYASDKTNKTARLWDMLWTTFRNYKKTDLVLIDTYSTQNFYYAVLVGYLCRMLNLPYIPILRGGNLPFRLKKSPKLSKNLFKNALVNVSPSLYLKSAFEALGYDNLVYIPNTLTIAKYPFYKKNYDQPRLLWVRSFSEIYNPTLAIQVLVELQQRGYNASLCMVGPDTDGSLSQVKALAKQLKVSVKFTGKLTKSEWNRLSKEYNIFINTTNFDNMPVSVIEAMALGLPVVSTNVGGLPYLITDGVDGMLVPPNDKIAMANAICSVFENLETTEAMVLKARQKVEAFDWEKVNKLWDKVLGDL